MENNTVLRKPTFQNAWDKAEAEYLANPTPDNYRKLEKKAKVYELGYMLLVENERRIKKLDMKNKE